MCETCSSKPKNFFVQPNFVKKIIYLEQKFSHINFKSMSYTIFADGISPFRKSKSTLWPIFLVSNELNYHQRYDIDNIIILGIYFGYLKPELQILLKMIIEPNLRNNSFCFDYNGNAYELKITTIVADKPARAMLLNMQNFNAKFGCIFCLTNVQTQIINNQRHVFIPYSCEFLTSLRSNAGSMSTAYSALSSKIPEYGIKGYSFLANLSSINIVESNCIDYMHSICLGVVKSICTLLFKNNKIPNELRFGSKIPSFDRIISKFKVSSLISGSLNTIHNLNNWNAKDYRNFLLYIFPIVFSDYKSRPFFNCILNLRHGIFLLLRPNILEEDFTNAETFLRSFRQEFDKIFGAQYSTPNFHDIDHLVDCARKFGPLFENSGFNFEHINGRLKRLCKGNKRLDKQIIEKLGIFSNNIYSDKCRTPDVANFLSKRFKKNTWAQSFRINNYISICGKITKTPCSFFNDTIITPFSSKRAIVDGQKIAVSSYCLDKGHIFSYFLSKDKKFCIELKSIFFSKLPPKAFYVAKKFSVKKIFFGIYEKNEFIGIDKGELEYLLLNKSQVSTLDDFCFETPFYECF